MTKRTRLFVLGASATLVIGVGTAGVASYVGFEKIGLIGNSPGDLGLIPGTTRMMAFADIRHLMDSDLRRTLLPSLGLEAGANPESTQGPAHLLAETGVNIETDVDSVLVAFVKDGPAAQEDLPLLLVRGIFDASRIEALILSHGGVASEHKGTRLVTADAPTLGVAFIEAGLIAIGPPSSVRLALDTRAAGTGSITQNADLMRLVRRVEDGHTWAVARFDALQGQSPVPAEIMKQLPSISWLAASGQVDSGLSAAIHAETRDEQSAQDLREVIRGFVALVRMQVGQQPAFADVVNSIVLSGDGNTVSLGFSVPAETISRLGALAAQGPRLPAAGQSPLRPAAPSRVRSSAGASI